jgi:hypothetical protein
VDLPDLDNIQRRHHTARDGARHRPRQRLQLHPQAAAAATAARVSVRHAGAIAVPTRSCTLRGHRAHAWGGMASGGGGVRCSQAAAAEMGAPPASPPDAHESAWPNATGPPRTGSEPLCRVGLQSERAFSGGTQRAHRARRPRALVGVGGRSPASRGLVSRVCTGLAILALCTRARRPQQHCGTARSTHHGGGLNALQRRP